MKIIITREGFEKSKENTNAQYNDEAAVKFLAEILNSKDNNQT